MRRFRFFALSILLTIFLSLGEARAERPSKLWETVVKTATFSTAQSATTLWTPTTGYKFVILGGLISCDRAVTVRLQVSGTDVVPPMYIPSQGVVPIGNGQTPVYVSGIDSVLTYTSAITGTAGGKIAHNHGQVSVMVWGYEEQ